MPEQQRPLKVFLCHASADKPKVRDFYRFLKRRGIQPWLDVEDLLPGQAWQIEIPKAIETSDAIIIFLSKESVDKEGYVQKEIKFALNRALEMPEGRIFIIPARLEECESPYELKKYHWVDLFAEGGYEKLMKSLKVRAEQLKRVEVKALKRDSTEQKIPKRQKSKLKDVSVTVGNDVNGNIIIGDHNSVVQTIPDNEIFRPLINLQSLQAEMAKPWSLLIEEIINGDMPEKKIYVDQIEKPVYKEYELSEINCVIGSTGATFQTRLSPEQMRRVEMRGHEDVKDSERGVSYLTKPFTTFLLPFSLKNVGREVAINVVVAMINSKKSSRWQHFISLLPNEKVTLRFLVDVPDEYIQNLLGKYKFIVEYSGMSKRYKQEYDINIEQKSDDSPVTFQIGLGGNQPELSIVA